ncbi:MAG: DUF1634 domain-containing protein [Candidatus Binatus sp.]
MAVLLRYGSWLASAAIGLGFALALCDSRFGTRNLAILPNMRIAAIGIVLFILLPTLRVLLMLLVFIREGDFRLAATAGLVLAIILLGIFLGLRTPSGMSPRKIVRLMPIVVETEQIASRRLTAQGAEGEVKRLAAA